MRPRLQQTMNLAKRVHRRVYAGDYLQAELNQRWAGSRVPDAPYAERVHAVVPDADSVNTLLIFKPDEIGDAVYALPAVVELKRVFPHARVLLLCQRLTQPLYERTSLFDEIVAVRPRSRLGRPYFDTGDAVRGFSTSAFDVSVYLRTYSATFRQFRRIPARIKLHPVDPMMRSDSVYRAGVGLWSVDREHQALQMLRIVGRVSNRTYGFDDVIFPDFHWTAEDQHALQLTFGGAAPERYFVVHPFAKHETRQYPLDYWRELIPRLQAAAGGAWVIVGGPGDPQIEGLRDVVQTQGKLSLAQSGYLISRATAFLGVLSGPAHWSGALGTPTVTIMSGHSLPVEWAPLGRSLVVRADVPCAPCHQPTCPKYGLACLIELTPSRIEGEVVDFLESTARVGASR